ncbi:MAG: OsmC family protein [Geminicoccales bacterium]
MKRKAEAVWHGSGKEGQGALTTGSDVLKGQAYSWRTRFAEGKGTNPEELIAAAHAGCFSMALAFALSGAGHEAEEIRTGATVSLDQQDGGFAITSIHLDLEARIPGIDEREFLKLAQDAKEGCPVSKLFKAPISLDAKLTS